MQETWVQSLGREDPLEKGMATYSSILAWRIPWTEELGGLQSMGWQRVGHDWASITKRVSCSWLDSLLWCSTISSAVLDPWAIAIPYTETESGHGVILRKITTFWFLFPQKSIMTFEFLSFYDSEMVISQPWESIQQLMTPERLYYIVLRMLS